MARMNARRAAFTAIEVLIVVTVLAILATLVAGAVLRVVGSSEKTATESTLTKLASILDVHWKSVIDSARRDYDALPPAVRQNLLTLADNATASPTTPKPHPRRDDRARLLYLKFRLKQEFPTSFAAALNPAPSFLPPQTVPGVTGTFTGKPAYVKALANVTLPVDKQSAALLVLTLEQGRGGAAATPLDQTVGNTFIRQESGVRYLVDSWGTPLQFFTFPATPSAAMTDLAGGADPQDPEGLLKPVNVSRWQAAPAFATLLHPQIDGRKLIPVIVSAGPDRELGGQPAATNPWMDLSGAAADDNIYSYRLRQTGARGD